MYDSRVYVILPKFNEQHKFLHYFIKGVKC